MTTLRTTFVVRKLQQALQDLDVMEAIDKELQKQNNAKRDLRIAKKVAKNRWRESMKANNSNFTKRNYQAVRI